MALLTDTYYTVLEGPTMGRLMLAAFGEGDDGTPNPTFLTFTVGTPGGQKHKIKINFNGLNRDRISRTKSYEIRGLLEAIDGKEQRLPRELLWVDVTRYDTSQPRRREAHLKIIDSRIIGVDLEKLFTEYPI